MRQHDAQRFSDELGSPLRSPELQEETEQEPASNHGEDQERFEKSRAYAEIGRLLVERPALSGLQLAWNTRRIRELAKKHGIEPPVGI